jgi:hypothetical protein
MLKLFTLALVTLSFNLTPVQVNFAHAEDSAPKAETAKADVKADSKDTKAGHECESCKHGMKKGDKECACHHKKDCKCTKADCKSGECMKKGSKKYCKHCAEHHHHDEGQADGEKADSAQH